MARRIASDGYDGNLRLWTLEKQSLRLVPGLVHEVDAAVALILQAPWILDETDAEPEPGGGAFDYRALSLKVLKSA